MNIKRKTLSIIIVLMILIGMTVTSVGAATANMNLINLTFDSVSETGTIDLQLIVSGYTTGITAAEVYIAYNPSLVTIDAASPVSNFFGMPVVGLNEITNNTADTNCPTTAGAAAFSAECTHFVGGGSPPQTDKTGTAMRYTFSSAGTGTACFIIVFGSMSDADSGPVSPTLGPEVCIAVTKIVPTLNPGTVTRQGAAGVNQDCTSVADYIAPASLQSTLSTTQTTGAYNFGTVTSGTHYLIASYPGYLSARTTDMTVTSPITVASTILRGGDANNDTFINILDVGIIIGRWGATGVAAGSTGTNLCTTIDDPGDINDDGNINIGDLAIVVGNWGLIGPTTWTP